MSEQTTLQLAGSVFASVVDTESARFARLLGTALTQLERQLLGLIAAATAGKPGALARVGRLLVLRREIRNALTTSGYAKLVRRASLDAVERMAAAVASRRIVQGASGLGRVTTARLDGLARLMAADLLGIGEAAAGKLWRASALAIYSGQPPAQILATLAKELDKTKAQAQSLFDTQVSIVGRQIVAEADRAEPDQAYLYVGPVDGLVRPFCEQQLGLVSTKDAIDALDNGQLPNPFLTGGGYNCRHSWMAVSDPELIALANTGERAPGFTERLAARVALRRRAA